MRNGLCSKIVDQLLKLNLRRDNAIMGIFAAIPDLLVMS